jgi:hypothetical protein
MSDINKRLADWNRDIAKSEQAAAEIRVEIMRRKDGPSRRFLLLCLRLFERIAATGKRWRAEDLRDD